MSKTENYLQSIRNMEKGTVFGVDYYSIDNSPGTPMVTALALAIGEGLIESISDTYDLNFNVVSRTFKRK